MKPFGYALLVFAFLFTGSPRAQSQGLGTLTGTVVDASTHAPIASVRVTASAPQLQGEQAVKTDSTGTYLVPQLPPGTYAILFEAEGYKLYAQRDIALDADRTLRCNVELRPEYSVDY